MILTGTFPILTDGDTVYSLKSYSERMAVALGHQTGWTNLTIADSGANFAAVSGWTPQIRRVGKVVQVRGQVSCKNTTSLSKPTLIIPPEFRPSANMLLQAVVAGTSVLTPMVDTGGVYYVFVGGGYLTTMPAAGQSVPLSGMWLID